MTVVYRVVGEGWEIDYPLHRDGLAREWKIEAPDGSEHLFLVDPLESRTVLRLICDGTTYTLTILPGNRPGRTLRFILDDEYYELDVRDPIDLVTELLGHNPGTGGDTELRSVMPGVIRKLLVSEGDLVDLDQSLFILEAMKMENEVRSPVAGIVQRVATSLGATVATDDLLAVLSPPPD